MGKLLTFILGFGVLVYVAYAFLFTRKLPDGTAEAPKATLERVQDQADKIEADMKQRAEQP